MAKGLNRVTIIGNLGRNPEVRYTSHTGDPVCSVSVAVNERRKRGETWADHTEWFRVTCFGRTATAVATHLEKGAKVYVEGSLRAGEYVDKDGVTRWKVEIAASQVIFLSAPKSARSADLPDTKPPEGVDDAQTFYDDALPF